MYMVKYCTVKVLIGKSVYFFFITPSIGNNKSAILGPGTLTCGSVFSIFFLIFTKPECLKNKMPGTSMFYRYTVVIFLRNTFNPNVLRPSRV